MICWDCQVCEYQGLEISGLEAVFILRTFFNTVEILAVWNHPQHTLNIFWMDECNRMKVHVISTVQNLFVFSLKGIIVY